MRRRPSSSSKVAKPKFLRVPLLMEHHENMSPRRPERAIGASQSFSVLHHSIKRHNTPYRPGRNEGTQDKFETLSTAPLNGRKAWGKGSLSVSRAVEVCHSAVLGEVLCQLGLQKVRTVHLRQATSAGELRHEHRGMTPQCLHGWGQHQALEQQDGRPSSAGWRGDGTRWVACIGRHRGREAAPTT